jgi:voltage-gated potassium channel
VVGRTIQQLQLRREVGIVVLAIRGNDGAMLFNPPAETPISAGGFLIVIGRQEDLQALENLASASSSGRK